MKRYYAEYKSDKFNRLAHDPDTGQLGCYWHYYGAASTIKTAKGYFSKIKKYAAEHGETVQEIRIYDTWGDCAANEHVPCVYQEVV
ncbi:MAG: hypothetical protein IJ874_05805 [Ruminococcus sp.]|nr:hypothetical protein [Ruminococcus sp.]